MSPAPIRKSAGRRPVPPVRQQNPPDDWLCTWSYRIAVWSRPEREAGVWELKYIHAACHEHALLPAA